MASIKAICDKKGKITGYKVRVCLGRDDQYSQIWRSKVFPRPEGRTPAKEKKEIQAQADAWEKALKEEYKKTGTKTTKENITLEQFIREHWFPDHVEDGTHSPSTVAFYRYMSDDIIAYFKRKRLSSLDAEAVKRYIKYLNTQARTKQGKPYSPASVQHHFAVLRIVLEYARRFRYIKEDPCQDLKQKDKPRRPKVKVDFLPPSEAQRFMQALEEEPLYWRAMMNVLLTTGLRRGEAVGLQWGDIDTDKLTITVTRNVTIDRDSPDKLHIGATKTGEDRIVPISPRVLALLAALKEEQQEKYGAVLMPSAFIFCRTIDPYVPAYPTEPTRWQRKFVERHALPKVSPHDLRHTAATLSLESGANLKQVQTLLGHADPATTMKFYAGVTDEAQRRTVEGIEALLNAENL